MRGHLDLVLLATLQQVGPAHGYALIVALREASGGAFELAEGTIYPALHKLEREGLVASAWSSDAARRRRVYELTAAGAASLAQKRSEWTRLVDAVAAVLASARHGLATNRGWGWSAA